MLVEFHIKEYEKPHVHALKKMKHNEDQQIKGQKHIDNKVHLVWGTSSGPTQCGEASS